MFVREIQTLLSSVGYYTGAIDGEPGPKTEAAVALALRLRFLSSFADPADITAFRAAKARGLSDEEAFAFGDNGLGEWGDSTVQGTGPAVALPPECIIAKWGSLGNGRGREVIVTTATASAKAVVKDVLEHLDNIKDGACCDCNPDLVALLGQKPPMMIEGSWA